MSPDSGQRPLQEASSSASATQIADQRVQSSAASTLAQSRIIPGLRAGSLLTVACDAIAKGSAQ